MRIGLLSGITLYPLAGESGVSERTHSSAGDFELTAESAKQIAQFVRADYALPLDRGNLLQTLAFTTSRLFATPAAAWLWALDYDGAIPRSGTLVFDTGSGIRHLLNAVVDPPRRRTIGCTVLLTYSVAGGQIITPV